MWSEAPAAFEVEEQLPVDQVNYSWHLISWLVNKLSYNWG
jgi:hypothetical protein